MDGDGRVYGDKVEIGADEVTCTETSHPNDWNADGVVNFEEFKCFSQAWLAVSTDPNYNASCDLDTDLDVDLTDLMIFIDDTPWLWIACWKTDLLELQQQQAMQMMSSSISLESVGVTTVTVAASASGPVSKIHWVAIEQGDVDTQAEVQELPLVEGKSIEKQILDLQDSIEFLEQIWTKESDIQQEINSDEWQEFMDSVYKSLSELEMLRVENTETEE
jgi:hypothetical protein